MDYTMWADYYAYISYPSEEGKDSGEWEEESWDDETMKEESWDDETWEENYDDYYYDDYYNDEIDYDLLYSYAPWDWGYSETWMDGYICADSENYYEGYIDSVEYEF